MYKNFYGIKIMLARKEAGMGQHDLAKLLKTTNVVVSRWENGTYKPNVESLNKLATALKKPVEYFFEGVSYDHKIAELSAEYSPIPVVDAVSIKKVQNGYVVNYENQSFIETNFKTLMERLRKIFR